MKKYYFKKGNREVKLGDKVTMQTPVDTSYGKGVATVDVEITEATLKKLTDDGLVIAKSSPSKEKEDGGLSEAIKKLKNSKRGVLVVKADEDDNLEDIAESIMDLLLEDGE